MPDPKRASAERAGRRGPRSLRRLGWVLALVVWAVASDARPWLALLSVLAAVVVRTVYVTVTSWGKGRSVVWSSWFFAVAAFSEVVWLALSR
jgi:hypothetical protein